MHALTKLESKWDSRLRSTLRGLAGCIAALPMLAIAATAVPQAAPATPAGVVEFARGVGFAQTKEQTPRTLGKGMALSEGDRLTTSDGAAAIIRMEDGTRMTLRPNTEMVVQKYQYREGNAENGMVMQLLRGGFRAITGLISKNAPNAARVRTATATVGIRGTDFDARLCGAECREESAQVKVSARPNHVHASAKVVTATGTLHAVDASGKQRVVVEGASVYAGDTLVTGADGRAVLVFRDDSRMTLGGNTRFRVESFVYDEKNPQEGNFLVSLVRGSLRALTGLIGKANQKSVQFKTPTATIGIRGTGLDLECPDTAQSKDPLCNFYAWQGTVEVRPVGMDAAHVLQVGQGVQIGRDHHKPLTAPTLESIPRPDKVPVDLKQLFTSGDVKAEDEGLFVYVRDGHIEVISKTEQKLHLGRGETGFAGASGNTGRPAVTPLFIQFDKVPMPNQANPMLYTVLSEVNKPSSNQCR
ncbi:FecR family protein [Candidatus Symbiobacter mobilis]|uniref:FecR protein domain-containing protein n=1 Tax=Candidatus Symbiobacter mobilis CR TaxID=946483 RepID=U5N855_9BURK|nr:FecR domain-containing protein [Candidatus Symbiobacter mobilis]AGX86339.1 hypothetical protein Cenrod_0211 [Candidatus Symbiobacter mobilis CR]